MLAGALYDQLLTSTQVITSCMLFVMHWWASRYSIHFGSPCTGPNHNVVAMKRGGIPSGIMGRHGCLHVVPVTNSSGTFDKDAIAAVDYASQAEANAYPYANVGRKTAMATRPNINCAENPCRICLITMSLTKTAYLLAKVDGNVRDCQWNQESDERPVVGESRKFHHGFAGMTALRTSAARSREDEKLSRCAMVLSVFSSRNPTRSGPSLPSYTTTASKTMIYCRGKEEGHQNFLLTASPLFIHRWREK